MTKCDIRISMLPVEEARKHAPEDCDFDSALRCSVKLQDATMGDKMQLMHIMARALRLDVMDIMAYAMAETERHFDENTTDVPVEA